MSEATALAAIKTIIESVTSVGQVHDYERWAATWPATLELFTTEIGTNQNYLRGWTISCHGEEVDDENYLYDGRNHYNVPVKYKFTIRGFFQLEDANATEKSARTLVKQVIAALNKAGTLHNGTDFSATTTGPAHLDTFELRNFSGVHCHVAEISLTIGDYEAA